VNSAIQVERDAEGIEKALVDLFEESFQRSAIAESMSQADAETREHMLESESVRRLSPGYYDRASYLLDLGASLEAGVTYSAAELTRSDVIGLAALKRAKGCFEREHPQCGACGARQDTRFAPACKGCGAEFQRGSR
jgi:hypothetical protein